MQQMNGFNHILHRPVVLPGSSVREQGAALLAPGLPEFKVGTDAAMGQWVVTAREKLAAADAKLYGRWMLVCHKMVPPSECWP
jgi:hypothetical protein